jgi:uncharacterized membrane protein YhaH (DUF805 family)
MNPFKQLWSFNGRIGRIAYAGGWLLNFVVMLAAMAVATHLSLYWTPPEPFNLKDGRLLALIPIAVLSYWAHFPLTVKRLHDLGVTGWFSLLMIVPGANLIMIIVLLIARGEDNDNRYDPGAPSARAPAPAHHA